MRAFLATALGIVCLLAGLIFLLTPVPLGAPLLSLALVLLVASNRTAARLLLSGRRHSRPLDNAVAWTERRGGERLRRVLRRTRPGRLPRRAS
jgi:hypothetical protein